MKNNQPNLLIIFADQLRYQSLGFTGDHNVKTPNLDRFAEEALNFSNAVSGCPVCSPARASLLTGQYPDTHGVVLNDVCLENGADSFADVLSDSGYDTGYIGKWHIDGHGRKGYIPPERRHGFKYWKVLECTHNYWNSDYYDNDEQHLSRWEGYDAEAQANDACGYIREHSGCGKPFCLTLSWGTPHAPYETAPEKYRRMYNPEKITLRPNVNVDGEYLENIKKSIAGYNAHISALDDYFGRIMQVVEDRGISRNTIVVFWSDHGDMLGSQGEYKKQRPWDESIKVPLLIRWPEQFGEKGKVIENVINTPDIMPTMLSMCGAHIPDTVEGNDYFAFLKGKTPAPVDAALLACYHPFGQYTRQKHNGREYRGVRTKRYTYVRDHAGPWMLYDNEKDPYQLVNLVEYPEFQTLLDKLEKKLQVILRELNDDFPKGEYYIEKFNYTVDETGTVPYWLKRG